MGTGGKIALGCGCLVLAAGAVTMGVVVYGTYWAKSKVAQVTGGLDKISAKSSQISALEKKANANPYTAPADGVVPEARLVKFLEVRKQVYDVYDRFQADIKELERKQKARGSEQASFSDALSGAGKVAQIFGDVRLAQVQALADLGMSEQEYRDIQMAVYKSAWAAESQKQSGKTPSEALAEANRQMQESMRTGLEAARQQGVSVPAFDEKQAQESQKQMAAAAKALEVPTANVALFRKYEADIKKYAMTGLELIGL
ncbi:MAG TPA: hypothetical protein VMX54_12430 [Vicinamibacteria bacterium]|nr:hypothetical protein [Vicinamibacteria bacterium]